MKPPSNFGIQVESTNFGQALEGCKGGNRISPGIFSRAGWSGRQRSDWSATPPLGIVSFLLTPQERQRRIRATFPWVSGPGGTGAEKTARHSRGRKRVQYLPGWTVQCINPECAARGHWLRATDSGGELCSNCSAPLRNVPPPLGPRLRMRPRSLGSYRPPGRSPGRQR